MNDIDDVSMYEYKVLKLNKIYCIYGRRYEEY